MGLLLNDTFTLSDLNIPFVNKNTCFFKFQSLYYLSQLISGRNSYFFHKSLSGNNKTEICNDFYDNLTYLLSFDEESFISQSLSKKDKIPFIPYIQPKIEKIYNNFLNGYIVINNIKIFIEEYEVNGEYMVLHRKDKVIHQNHVLKYYSNVSGQYTLFLTDGSIRSYDDIVEVEMSKDIRITTEDLKKIWRD